MSSLCQRHWHQMVRRFAHVSYTCQRERWRDLCSLVVLLACVLSGCAAANTTSTTQSKAIQVIAAEDFWGSIASQLGGAYVQVTSVVSSPSVDPHDYESTTNDARNFAQADYVILNGAGYDDWGQRLLDANPTPNRKVLTVANILGKKRGDNPHFWYHPDFVETMADHITADYQALDPAHRTYFAQQRVAFENALQPYHELVTSMQTTFAGTKIGSSESIAVYMAQALHLNLITPSAYLNAENNGTEPPTDAVAQFHQQITHKEMAVMLIDVQNISHETQNLEQMVKQQGIPIVEITETIRPAGRTFQQWQLDQLRALQNALTQQQKG